MNAITPPARMTLPEPARFSVAEFMQMMGAFDMMSARVELDQGTIIRMPPHNYPHVRVQRLILNALQRVLGTTTGALVEKELGVRIGDDIVRIIDVAVYADPGDEPHLVDGRLVGLAVEVADSSLTYDLGITANDYAAAAIADYWVVDPTARVVHLLTDPTPDGYAKRRVVPFGAPLHAACLAGPVVFEG